MEGDECSDSNDSGVNEVLEGEVLAPSIIKHQRLLLASPVMFVLPGHVGMDFDSDDARECNNEKLLSFFQWNGMKKDTGLLLSVVEVYLDLNLHTPSARRTPFRLAMLGTWRHEPR